MKAWENFGSLRKVMEAHKRRGSAGACGRHREPIELSVSLYVPLEPISALGCLLEPQEP